MRLLEWDYLYNTLKNNKGRKAAMLYPIYGQYIIHLEKWALPKICFSNCTPSFFEWLFSHQPYILYYSLLSISFAFYFTELFCPKLIKANGVDDPPLNNLEETPANTKIIRKPLDHPDWNDMTWSQQKGAYWQQKNHAKIIGPIVLALFAVSTILGITYSIISVFKVTKSLLT